MASQIVHPLTRTSQFADILMRDNEKFNKSISQEFEIPVEFPYQMEGDEHMQDSILGILKKYVFYYHYYIMWSIDLLFVANIWRKIHI